MSGALCFATVARATAHRCERQGACSGTGVDRFVVRERLSKDMLMSDQKKYFFFQMRRQYPKISAGLSQYIRGGVPGDVLGERWACLSQLLAST